MNDDINTKRTELANQMAAAGAAVLDFNGTAAALAAIPDTEPQQYVAAGTPENIAAILPATICPQRRQKHGERPSAADLEWEDAATSGDAPTDLQQLKALALAYQNENGEHWYNYLQLADGISYESAADFMVKVSPAVVLGLIARIEHLTTVPEQAPSTEQEWAKVDPAVAFHLIERHAENWADAGRMMLAWRDANPAPATASGDELPTIDTPEFRELLAAAARSETRRDAWANFVAHIDGKIRAAVSAATKPTADLSRLQRYGTGAIGMGGEFGPDLRGDYVRFADVQSLLATKPAAAPAVPEELTPMLLLNAALLIEGDQFASTVSAAKKASIVDKLGRVADWLAAVRKSPAASTTGAAQTAEQVWNQAMEAAAKVCEKNDGPHRMVAGVCADEIRALKRPTPTHSSEAGDATT